MKKLVYRVPEIAVGAGRENDDGKEGVARLDKDCLHVHYVSIRAYRHGIFGEGAIHTVTQASYKDVLHVGKGLVRCETGFHQFFPGHAQPVLKAAGPGVAGCDN